MKCIVYRRGWFYRESCLRSASFRGHDVVGVDDFSTGRASNLETAHRNGRFRLLHKSITELMSDDFGNEADWIFHFAGRADLVPSIQKPEDYFKVNVEGTFRVLEVARSLEIKRLIYAASSTCYGIAEVVPTPETFPCVPRHPYGLTKYLGEQLVMHWALVYGLPAVSLRLFNVYGPRSRTSGATAPSSEFF